MWIDAGILALASTQSIAWGQVVIGLLGGLALFLFGMDQMTSALKGAAGGGLRTVLGRFTTNRVAGVATGTVVTAVTQSSSVTTVLLVGFVSAGLMTLQQSVGVIMGANVGSTFTAQIIAFNVTQYALAIVAIGFAAMFGGRNERMRRYGAIVMGLGLIFFGMKLMSDAMQPLRGYQPFIDIMAKMDVVVLGVLAGAVFTAVVQSSAATTGLVIVMAADELINLRGGIAIALGANIGTCATAMLATLGKPRAALQAAAVHILFNVVGVVIWLPFIGHLAGWVESISNEPARQIANAHTFFNIINVVLFIGFTGPIAAVVARLIPTAPADDAAVRPRYLDEALLATPALALDRVRMELGRMGRVMLDMLDTAAPVVGRGTEAELAKVESADDKLDALHGHVIDYLAGLGRSRLSRKEERRMGDLLAIANYLENMGDAIERNMVAIGRQRISDGIVVSEATGQKLGLLYASVHGAIESLVLALEDDDPKHAMRVVRIKREVRDHAHDVINHLGTRLTADAPNRVAAYRIEQEITEQLRRLYYFARHAAWHVTGREEDHPDDDGED